MTWHEWTNGQNETGRIYSGYTLPFKNGERRVDSFKNAINVGF